MRNFQALHSLVRKLIRGPVNDGFESSSSYWIERYAKGGNSGAGSYNHLAEFKAGVLNKLVVDHKIESVIEFGCGDGNQLRHADYPSYLGVDISPVAVEMCAKLFAFDATKRFALIQDYRGERADLALSLDVIYHLIEDTAFETHMQQLFSAAYKLVVIYSSDTDVNEAGLPSHVRHRRFSDWVAKEVSGWHLADDIQSPYPYDGDHTRTTFARFFVYTRQPGATDGSLQPHAY